MSEQFLRSLFLFVCNISETCFILLILDSIFDRKVPFRPWYYIIIAFVSFSGYLLLTFNTFTAGFQYLISFVLIMCYSSFWKGKLLYKVGGSFFILCVFPLLYTLCATIESVLFSIPYQTSYQSFALSLFTEFITLLIAWAFRKFSPHRKHVVQFTTVQSIIALFYPLVASFIMFLIMKDSFKRTDPLLVLIFILVFLSFIVHVILLETLNQQISHNLSLSLIAHRATSEQEKAEALQDAYSNQRKLTHEFTNHLSAINSMLQANNPDEAQRYIEEIIPNVKNHTLLVNTHNPVIDAILTEKHEKASQQNISVSLQLSDLSNVPLSSPDFVVIVSNLFNNAMEGCAGCENSAIVLHITNTKDEFFFSIRNTVPHNIVVRNNTPPKSTKNVFGHGFGLQNVIDLLNKYHAVYSIKCENCWFQVSFIINLPD